MVLDLKDKSWARIFVDGKRVFEGILHSGSNPVWSAQEKIKIRIGNAAAVFAYFNDKPLGVLGENGEIIEFQGDTIQINETIDRDLKKNFKDFF